MAVNVYFSTPLLKATENNDMTTVSAGTIKEINEAVCTQYPLFKDILFDTDGNINKVINIYVNDEDIRTLMKEDTPVKDGDEVYYIPTIAGG